MTRMLCRAARWVVVATLSLTIGLHWAAIQSAAWAGMLVSYTQETTFVRAVAMTFDGHHPCRLCHLVRQAKPDEKAPGQGVLSGIQKLDGFFAEGTPFLLPRFALVSQPFRDPFPPSRGESPPLPPPRAA
jgi:hypothetical protein